MKRILVVTSDSATRASARRTLVDLGYAVQFAPTGAKAVDRVRRRRPAAVMVDVGLASQSCPAFVEACRREASRADMPILVMAPTPRAAVDAIRAGAQGCVRTPFEPATLLPMLSQIHLPTPN